MHPVLTPLILVIYLMEMDENNQPSVPLSLMSQGKTSKLVTKHCDGGLKFAKLRQHRLVKVTCHFTATLRNVIVQQPAQSTLFMFTIVCFFMDLASLDHQFQQVNC